MANTNTHELLRVSSPTMLVVGDVVEGETITSLDVKGFASVEKSDRSGDTTNPAEFNIPEFMAAPTLLLNHKFWIDFNGNPTAIGMVHGMWIATVQKNDADDSVWNIRNEHDKEIITTMPKAKMPSLAKGDRGLFVKATVTVRDVIEQIQRGELGGMSWRGLVVVSWKIDPVTNLTVRVLQDIDLFEVSLVHVPDMNQATFLVGKDGMSNPVEYDFENVQVWRMELPKSKFITEKMAVGYLEGHKTLSSEITHSDDVSWYADQQPAERFDLSKTVRVSMGDSFTLMAPLVSEPVANNEPTLVGELLDLTNNAATLIAKDATMSVETKTAAEESAVKDDVEKAADKTKTGGGTDKKKDLHGADKFDKDDKKKSAEDQMDALSSAVGVKVGEALKPALEGIANGMTLMGETMKTISEKMAGGIAPTGDTKTEEKVTDTKKEEVGKSVDFSGMLDVLNGFAESLVDTQKQVADIAKTALDMAKDVPNEGAPRDEQVKSKKEDVAKGAGDDPNDCMGSLMPFGG